jgi:hypothetical protein
MYRFPAFTRIILASMVCVAASGCAYIIPPDQNAPRNNTVVGPVRKPQNNPANPRVVKPQAVVNPKPVAEAYPPAAQAEQQVASLAAPVAPVAALAVANERRVPPENAQVAAAGYPPIDSVPPRPATEGPESVKQRMNDAQQSLEQGRATAAQSKEKLSQDLSAEPSMLSDMPKTQQAVPSNESVRQPLPQSGANVQPVNAQPVAAAEQRIVVSTNQPPALPPAPNLAPPPPPAGGVAAMQPVSPQPVKDSVRQVSAPVLAAVAPLPSVNVGLPPEQAAPEHIASVVSGDTMTVARTHPATGVTVRKGDFDPLAMAEAAPAATNAAPVVTQRAQPLAPSAYVASRYMSPSRYYDQR